MKVSIIMPAYNEEKRIGETLNKYSIYFNSLKNRNILNYEILVVINGTTDKTEEVVKLIKKKNNTIRYLNLEKGDKGYAVIEGFKNALKRNNELIGFVDTDMATSPESFYRLIKEIEGYDCAIASRWVKGSIIKTKQTSLRRIMSISFNFLVRSLFLMPYKDTQCGAKLFRRKIIESIINEIGITRWAFDVDLIYRIRKKGFRIKEAPTIWEDKKNSKLNISKVPFEMFAGIVRLRLINSPFKFIVRVYDKLPESIKIHHR